MIQKAQARPFSFSWADVNPIGFLEIYKRGSSGLQKLTTISNLMLMLEGKNIADLEEVWKRTHLGWDTVWCRNEIVVYGLCITLAGSFAQPYLLKNMSTRGFTSFTNRLVILGFFLRGIPHTLPFLGSSFLMLPGIGGSCGNALKAVTADKAVAEGFGKGEFAAYESNLRSLVRALTPALLGNYYAFCERRGLNMGTVYVLLGIIGAVLPQVLLSCVRDDEMVAPLAPGIAAIGRGAVADEDSEDEAAFREARKKAAVTTPLGAPSPYRAKKLKGLGFHTSVDEAKVKLEKECGDNPPWGSITLQAKEA